jgi:RNA polymerase sigma factor (sigma-70 family)
MGDEPDARGRADDELAFERSLRTSARAMVQLAYFVLNDFSRAEDAAMRAFVAARQRHPTLKDRTAFRSWLRAIVLRECLRWQRHSIFRLLALTDRVVAQVEPDTTIQSGAALAMTHLSPRLRAIVFLHFYEGIPIAEVAHELGIAEPTAKTQLSEALGRLGDLASEVRTYAAERSGRVSMNQADALVSRAAVLWSKRRGAGRYLTNLVAGATLALVIFATGIVIQGQLHLFQPRAPSVTFSGPLPPIPNEVVNLINPTAESGLMIPFRLRDGKALSPRSQPILAPGIALHLTSAVDCSITTVSLVDPITHKDVRSEVVLPDCYDTPVLLPDGTVLLDHSQTPAPRYFRSDLGAIRYDWRTGRVVKQYPTLSLRPGGGLVSKDAKTIYTLDLLSADTFLDFTDLESGARLAHIAIVLADTGGVAGGIALSTDQRTLFVNEGYRLASFDAVSGAAGPVVSFTGGATAAPSTSSWLLPSVAAAEAAGGVEIGHGIAVDPKGRWVAALGYNDPALRGIWLTGTSSRFRLFRRFYQSTALSAIAFSLDGGVLYAIDGTGLLLLDPQTGRVIKGFRYPVTAGVYGIAGVQAQ